jgi:hypothetical protein
MPSVGTDEADRFPGLICDGVERSRYNPVHRGDGRRGYRYRDAGEGTESGCPTTGGAANRERLTRPADHRVTSGGPTATPTRQHDAFEGPFLRLWKSSSPLGARAPGRKPSIVVEPMCVVRR